MSSENPKLAVFAQFATVAKSVGHPHRIELMELVSQGEHSVERLAALTRSSIANTSQHLQQLKRAGLVSSRRDGKRVRYRLADDRVVQLLAVVRDIAERNLAEVQQIVKGYFHERDAFEAISREELSAKLKDRAVTLLDVRPEDEFAQGHLPGAINIPVELLEDELSMLPSDVEIVAYCRGAYCILAFEAVAMLRGKGYDIRRLEDGFPEWRVAGLPVERTRA